MGVATESVIGEATVLVVGGHIVAAWDGVDVLRSPGEWYSSALDGCECAGLTCRHATEAI